MRFVAIFVLGFSILCAAEKETPRNLPRPQEPHWKVKIEERFPSGQPSKVVFYEELGDNPPVAVKLTAYHPSGQIKLEADVTSKQNDEDKTVLIANGIEVLVDEKGNLEKITHYDNGVLEGEMKVFYPNNQVKATCNFKQGKRNGSAIAYHLDGGKAEEVPYVDDKIIGDLVKYYAKGGKASLVPYVDGMIHGKAMEWYESGSLKSVRNFEKGVLDTDGKGPALIVYSEDHAMLEVQDYRRGEMIGTHMKYHPNGKEAVKVSYKNGKKDGKEVFYSAEGKMLGEGEYREGTPVGKHARFHENGAQGFLAMYDDKGGLSLVRSKSGTPQDKKSPSILLKIINSTATSNNGLITDS